MITHKEAKAACYHSVVRINNESPDTEPFNLAVYYFWQGLIAAQPDLASAASTIFLAAGRFEKLCRPFEQPNVPVCTTLDKPGQTN